MASRLTEGTVAILGFGNQGEAHASNLRDAGLEVVVGARPEGRGSARAKALGFPTLDLAHAASRAAVAAVLLPDEVVPALWPGLLGALAPDAALVFAHGYNLLYSGLPFPERGDVVLVAPTAPGRVLRSLRERGESVPGYLAVHRDRSGSAWTLAGEYADRLGCSPVWRTTVREETEVDLFGEQAVLCGGLNALLVAAFETLVAEGYAPEMAYLECVHQLVYLADLLHERGLAGSRRSISATALFGDLTRGPRIVGEAARSEMKSILGEIRSGAFAREWAAEAAGGKRWLGEQTARTERHPLEEARRRVLEAEKETG
ncbi:MAG TPA: ketol-acid reductoisomerase [Terriglobales bacterium]|nr:ketol-acid reductoisomerase [Terriglobales bacterium]